MLQNIFKTDSNKYKVLFFDQLAVAAILSWIGSKGLTVVEAGVDSQSEHGKKQRETNQHLFEFLFELLF